MTIATGGDSQVARIVKMSGITKIYDEYQNDLIDSDDQAVRFGLQKIFPFYYGYKQASINAPFEDVMDGEIASIDANIISENARRYRVTSVNITFESEPKKVRIALETEGDYAI